MGYQPYDEIDIAIIDQHMKKNPRLVRKFVFGKKLKGVVKFGFQDIYQEPDNNLPYMTGDYSLLWKNYCWGDQPEYLL